MIGMKLSCNGGFLGYANENAINKAIVHSCFQAVYLWQGTQHRSTDYLLAYILVITTVKTPCSDILSVCSVLLA
jgi:hypothetical protein